MQENAPFWALAELHDASLGQTMITLRRFAQECKDAGTAFNAEWQDEICYLNTLIPEVAVEWLQVWPGTQLHVRGQEDEIEPVFVLNSDPMESAIATVLHTDGSVSDINLDRDTGDGWQEAGQ